MSEKQTNEGIDLPYSEGLSNCLLPEVGGLLCDYLFGELAQEDAYKFREHLEACSYCVVRYSSLKAAFKRLRERPEILEAARTTRVGGKKPGLSLAQNKTFKAGGGDY